MAAYSEHSTEFLKRADSVLLNHSHINSAEYSIYLCIVLAGDDAVGVKWQDMSSELDLYASHKHFIHNTAQRHDAHWWCHPGVDDVIHHMTSHSDDVINHVTMYCDDTLNNSLLTKPRSFDFLKKIDLYDVEYIVNSWHPHDPRLTPPCHTPPGRDMSTPTNLIMSLQSQRI